jgi:hypothetical protein
MYERTGRARINHQRRPPAHFNVSGHPFHSWYHHACVDEINTREYIDTMRSGHQLPASDNKYPRNSFISLISLGCDVSFENPWPSSTKVYSVQLTHKRVQRAELDRGAFRYPREFSTMGCKINLTGHDLQSAENCLQPLVSSILVYQCLQVSANRGPLND